MPKPEPTTICPQNPQQWRDWLHAHHATEASVWLVYHKKKSATPTLTWSEAVDEALCFGWIDSRAQPIDAETYRQFFSRRKPKSVWSKINKEKIVRLTTEGRMTATGLASIETAQQNGSWTILDAVEALQLPPDLEQALQQSPAAHRFFLALSRTDKRNMLQWLVLAQRPATRQSRLAEIVEMAGQQLKPKQFRNPKKTA